MEFSGVLNSVIRGGKWSRDAIIRAHLGVDQASPTGLFGKYLFFAMLLFIATAATGLVSIDTVAKLDGGGKIENVPRQKGFGWELNWGLNHLVVVPVALFCCGLVLREISRLVKDVAESGMVVNDRFESIPSDRLLDDWQRFKIGPFWFGVIAVMAFAMSWGEWYVGSFRPIVFNDLGGELMNFRGWTAGYILDPSSINRWFNALLSFVAFGAQGFIITYFLYTLGTILALSNWLFNYAIVPDLASTDDRNRMGFERFEPLIFRFLYMAVAFLVSFFSIKMQSIYNGSLSKETTVYRFVLGDLIEGFFADLGAVFQGRSPHLFDVGNANNYSTLVVSSACFILLMVALILPNLILSILAYQSRDLLERCLRREVCPPCDARKMTYEGCRARLQAMTFWPLRAPRPPELLGYVVFAGFCFFFYRLTLIFLGTLTFGMVKACYDRLVTRPGLDGPERQESKLPPDAPASPAVPAAPTPKTPKVDSTSPGGGETTHRTLPFDSPENLTTKDLKAWQVVQNERRISLIIKKVEAGSLEPGEESELEMLEHEASLIQERFFPQPVLHPSPRNG